MYRMGKPTLNQHEIERSPLPTLHEDNEGCHEVASLMALKTVTPWAQALLCHGETVQDSRVLTIGRRFIDVDFGWGVGFSTLHLIKKLSDA